MDIVKSAFSVGVIISLCEVIVKVISDVKPRQADRLGANDYVVVTVKGYWSFWVIPCYAYSDLLTLRYST